MAKGKDFSYQQGRNPSSKSVDWLWTIKLYQKYSMEGFKFKPRRVLLQSSIDATRLFCNCHFNRQCIFSGNAFCSKWHGNRNYAKTPEHSFPSENVETALLSFFLPHNCSSVILEERI